MNNDFPDYVNFYSSFDSLSKDELKDILEQNGWISRKESSEDFEFANEWSELNLLGDRTKTLLKGTIKNPEKNYKTLIDLFHNIKATFMAELYNKEQILVCSDKTV